MANLNFYVPCSQEEPDEDVPYARLMDLKTKINSEEESQILAKTVEKNDNNAVAFSRVVTGEKTSGVKEGQPGSGSAMPPSDASQAGESQGGRGGDSGGAGGAGGNGGGDDGGGNNDGGDDGGGNSDDDDDESHEPSASSESQGSESIPKLVKVFTSPKETPRLSPARGSRQRKADTSENESDIIPLPESESEHPKSDGSFLGSIHDQVTDSLSDSEPPIVLASDTMDEGEEEIPATQGIYGSPIVIPESLAATSQEDKDKDYSTLSSFTSSEPEVEENRPASVFRTWQSSTTCSDQRHSRSPSQRSRASTEGGTEQAQTSASIHQYQTQGDSWHLRMTQTQAETTDGHDPFLLHLSPTQRPESQRPESPPVVASTSRLPPKTLTLDMIQSDEEDSQDSLQFNIKQPEFSEEPALPKSEETIFKAGDLAGKAAASNSDDYISNDLFDLPPERKSKKHEGRRDLEEKSSKEPEEQDLPAYESTPKDDSDDAMEVDQPDKVIDVLETRGDEVGKSGVKNTDSTPVVEHVQDTQDTQIYSCNQDGQIYPVVAKKSAEPTAEPVANEPFAGPSHFGPTLAADVDEQTPKPDDPYEYHLSQSQHEREEFNKTDRRRKETRKRAQMRRSQSFGPASDSSCEGRQEKMSGNYIIQLRTKDGVLLRSFSTNNPTLASPSSSLSTILSSLTSGELADISSSLSSLKSRASLNSLDTSPKVSLAENSSGQKVLVTSPSTPVLPAVASTSTARDGDFRKPLSFQRTGTGGSSIGHADDMYTSGDHLQVSSIVADALTPDSHDGHNKVTCTCKHTCKCTCKICTNHNSAKVHHAPSTPNLSHDEPPSTPDLSPEEPNQPSMEPDKPKPPSRSKLSPLEEEPPTKKKRREATDDVPDDEISPEVPILDNSALASPVVHSTLTPAATLSPRISAAPSTSVAPCTPTCQPSPRETGTRVFAKWPKDKFYYPGIILYQEKNGKYYVQFDDNTSSLIREKDIVFEELECGEDIQAGMMKDDEVLYEPACILNVIRGEDSLKFEVSLNSGDIATVPQSLVALTVDQTKNLLSKAEKPTSITPQTLCLPPSQATADVSLDNLVDGTRRRSGNISLLATPETVTSTSNQKTTKGKGKLSGRPPKVTRARTPKQQQSPTANSADDFQGSSSKKQPGRIARRKKQDSPEAGPSNEIISSSSKKQTGIKSRKKTELFVEPADPEMATPASSVKRGRGRPRKRPLESPEDASARLPLVSAKKQLPLFTSTPTPRRTKRSKLQDEAEQPQSKKKLSVVEESESVRRSPRKATLVKDIFNVKGTVPAADSQLFYRCAFFISKGDKSGQEVDGDSTIHEEVPFDKDHVRNQIVAGGGVVLSKYDKHAVQLAKEVYLISDGYSRTLKYLQCLAADIPCLSHQWIRDSCNQGRRLPTSGYLLEAGFSYETKAKVERHFQARPLSGLNVHIASSDVDFREAWTSVLEAGGCNLVPKFSAKSDHPHLIVTDHKCPQSVVKRAKERAIPLVSTDWIIQSLINSRMVPYDADEHYRYDFQPGTEKQ